MWPIKPFRHQFLFIGWLNYFEKGLDSLMKKKIYQSSLGQKSLDIAKRIDEDYEIPTSKKPVKLEPKMKKKIQIQWILLIVSLSTQSDTSSSWIDSKGFLEIEKLNSALLYQVEISENKIEFEGKVL